MPGVSSFPMYDLLFDGRLCETLAGWREEGMTLQQIVDRIESEKGYRPSTSSLARWLAGECG